MLYVCWGADEIYQGLHGMQNYCIEDCNDLNDAIYIAKELSFEVINSFSDIYDSLEQEYEESIKENMSQKEKDEIHEDIYNEDACFSAWKIKEDVCKEYSQVELEKMLYEDPEAFVEEYCEM